MLFLFYDIVTALLHWKCCAMSKWINIISYQVQLTNTPVVGRASNEINERTFYIICCGLGRGSLLKLSSVVKVHRSTLAQKLFSKWPDSFSRSDNCVWSVYGCSRCSRWLTELRRVRRSLDAVYLRRVFHAFVMSYLDYCNSRGPDLQRILSAT